MKMQLLCEQFIEKANRPMSFGSMPVQPREAQAPILPMNRWQESNGALYKTYRFRRIIDRNDFVNDLLSYETTTEHHAEIRIDHDNVSVKVQTEDLGKVTEIDKEYAKYADVLFKNLVYSSPYHGDEGQ